MASFIKHTLMSALCMMLALILVVSGLSVATLSAVADTETPTPKTTVSSIRAVAYGIKANDVDNTWDVSGGKKSAISERGGQLRICVFADTSSNGEVAQYEETSWTDNVPLSAFTYKATGSAVQVDSQGVITALGDGETTITITPIDEDYKDLSATVKITTANQTKGLQVSKLEIVDSSGKAFGGTNIKFTGLSQIVKIYVRVTYFDRDDKNKKVIYSNYPSCPAAQKAPAGTFDALTYKVADENYLGVSNANGVGSLKSKANANTEVYASITGGDATKDSGMGLGVVYGIVGVTIDNGKMVDGESPADKLKVNVSYEKNAKKILKTKTYTPTQFAKLGTHTMTYTLTQSGGKYATDTAYGVYIETLLKQFDIDPDDVRYFTLAANDGANPGKITGTWLMRTTRYYYPNFDLGGSSAEKQKVKPMLALKDRWTSGVDLSGSATLNSGTRFRLVFGSAGKADGATDKSIKFINTFSVVLKGAAPSSSGDKKETKTEKKKKATSPSGGGSGNSPGAGKGGQGGGSAKGVGAGEASTSASELSESAKWRIYQMMNKSKSNVTDEYEDNPLEPFLIPTVIGVVVVAAGWRYFRFRRKRR